MQIIPSSEFKPSAIQDGLDGIRSFGNGDAPLFYEADRTLHFVGIDDDGKLRVGFIYEFGEFWRSFDGAFGATAEHARCVLEGVIWPRPFSDIERDRYGFSNYIQHGPEGGA
jgi:hypothetical protein